MCWAPGSWNSMVEEFTRLDLTLVLTDLRVGSCLHFIKCFHPKHYPSSVVCSSMKADWFQFIITTAVTVFGAENWTLGLACTKSPLCHWAPQRRVTDSVSQMTRRIWPLKWARTIFSAFLWFGSGLWRCPSVLSHQGGLPGSVLSPPHVQFAFVRKRGAEPLETELWPEESVPPMLVSGYLEEQCLCPDRTVSASEQIDKRWTHSSDYISLKKNYIFLKEQAMLVVNPWVRNPTGLKFFSVPLYGRLAAVFVWRSYRV